MAYNDDAVLAKLSALNETQESIVTVAQWVMFHRRHADRTGQLWLQRLKDSGSNKRLNLIYLANEVAQQSKARKKDDFLIAFSPVIAEATATAYKGATNDVQQKLRRVVEVWRARQIFEIPIQESVEAKIDELDKTRTSGKRMGGSIFSSSNTSSVPSEISPLVEPQQTVTKLVLSTKTSLNGANHQYDRITDPSVPVPSPPVHAARLNGVLKSLANAEGAVAEGIKARSVLIEELEKLLKANTDALAADQKQLNELASRRAQMDRKKNEVEDSIMRGFAPSSNPSTPSGPGASPGAGHSPITPGAEPDRPEVEALTPPGYPQPDGEPVADFNLDDTNGAQSSAQGLADSTNIPQPVSAGSDLLSSLSTSYGRPATPKKRKLNMANDFDIGGDAMDGLDADVAEMLWKENRNGH